MFGRVHISQVIDRAPEERNILRNLGYEIASEDEVKKVQDRQSYFDQEQAAREQPERSAGPQRRRR